MSSDLNDLDLGQTVRGFAAGQKLFHRYSLVRILGRGGMGIVWLARDEKLNRDVALKFLPELVMHDFALLDDLKRETNRSLELTHPHIVRIHDFVDDAQSACISMEYVDGSTLSALRAQQPSKVFEVDDLAPWIKQSCEALEYAHRRARIVHRDLKPANLMLNSRGDLKVADFGIARSLNDSMSMLTMARGSSGTLVYMSPQQLGGERASHLDDIYSFGATIYELLTGKPPFYSGGIETQIRDKVPPTISSRREELNILSDKAVPQQWEDAVAACLEKDPARRPASAMEVAWRLGLVRDYEREVAPESAKIVMDRAPIVATSAWQRRRGALIAAGFVLLLAVGSLAGWWFGVGRSKQKAASQSDLVNKTEEARPEEKTGANATPASSSFAEQVKAAAAAQVAEEKRKAEEAAAAEAKKKEEASRNIANANKEHPWENSLGMKFVPVPGTNVLFSVWETRVKDFAAFVDATGYKAEGEMYSLEEAGSERAGRTWKDPGFAQTREHAVCGVNWEDARAFCEWLTIIERKAGRLSAEQSYRLPTDLEWSAAVGLSEESGSTPEKRAMKVKGVYPWGSKFPPPAGAGNYAGSEARTGGWLSDWETIKGYRDDYPRTSPVGSFSANEDGIYDLGGNVWEWCQDWWNAEKKYRVLRGASWHVGTPVFLLSSSRYDLVAPEFRYDNNGFRCVLAVSASAPIDATEAKIEEPSKNIAKATQEHPRGKQAEPNVATATVNRVQITSIRKTFIRVILNNNAAHPVFNAWFDPSDPPLSFRARHVWVKVLEREAVLVKKNGAPLAPHDADVTFE